MIVKWSRNTIVCIMTFAIFSHRFSCEKYSKVNKQINANIVRYWTKVKERQQ